MSMRLLSVPFFNIINLSTAWGMGLNGTSSITMENTVRIEYGILSRKDPM
jgi:hypothetical protein